LKQAAKDLHLNVIAITDHDEISGALEALDLAPVYGIEVVPGMEISTAEGHLLALYIRNKIPAGLSLVKTVRLAADQGGICIAPHPAVPGASCLSIAAIRNACSDDEIAQTLVGIEVINAGIYNSMSHPTVAALMASLPFAQVGSSDAHVLGTIGKGRTLFHGFTAAHLRRALELRQTQALISGPANFANIALGWVSGYILRRAGWIQANVSPDAPVTLHRVEHFRPSRSAYTSPR
jgi:predicted metal-dependent phosphoesterase TrpH